MKIIESTTCANISRADSLTNIVRHVISINRTDSAMNDVPPIVVLLNYIYNTHAPFTSAVSYHITKQVGSYHCNITNYCGTSYIMFYTS